MDLESDALPIAKDEINVPITLSVFREKVTLYQLSHPRRMPVVSARRCGRAFSIWNAGWTSVSFERRLFLGSENWRVSEQGSDI